MSRTELVVQSILLPDEERFAACERLFFRNGLIEDALEDRKIPETDRWNFRYEGGEIVANHSAKDAPSAADGAAYDSERGCIVIDAGAIADFSCYLNMFSAKKWFRLTSAEDATLILELKGDGRIRVVGYDLDDFATIDEMNAFKERCALGIAGDELAVAELAEAAFSHDERAALSIELGRAEHTLLAFVVEAEGEGAEVFGGGWSVGVDEARVRDIDLAIATTTFKKEEYICANISKVKDMLAADPEFAEHFQMFVIDNGCSLDASALADDHVRIFPNANLGGAGGFSRGMIEAMRAAKRPTHLILMDDDVLVLTESFKRNYALLRIIRVEYAEHFISGAMLRLDAMDILHEDIGFVHDDGYFMSKKGPLSLRTALDCAANEVAWPTIKHEYAAWWYCCIPMSVIAEDNLPIPFFIRGDDAEYSVRAGSKVISMNGICVWHMGFGDKFNANMEYYQVIRNSLIASAFTPALEDVKFYNWTKVLCNRLTAVFAYDYADLILDAIEDYLKGPQILEAKHNLDLIREKGKKNEVMAPLAEVWHEDVDFEPVLARIDDSAASTMKRKLITWSLNGHKHLRSLVGSDWGVVPYDWEYNWGDILFRKTLLAVDPVHGQAIVRERDQARYEELEARREAVYARYDAEHEAVERAWKEAFPRLTSLDFWMDYLGIL